METEIDIEAFRKFLITEMDKRRLSVRGFAELIGVSHTTIVYALGYKNKVRIPSLDFLIKLAVKTNTDICTIAALLAPYATRKNALASLVASAASQLPVERQNILLDIIRGWAIEKPKQDGD